MRKPARVDPPAVLTEIKRLYEKGLGDFGTTSKAVGWKDPEGQQLRFEKLVEVIDDSGEPFTVNDLGCGYGAMFSFLDQRFGSRLQKYHGYDISADMLAAARVALPAERTTWTESADVTTEADYSFVSGTFNVRFEVSFADWEQFVQRTLVQLAACSRRGLAFNVLSTRVDWQAPHLYYADPEAYLQFCQSQISPSVELLHEYPLYEWTMLIRKTS